MRFCTETGGSSARFARFRENQCVKPRGSGQSPVYAVSAFQWACGNEIISGFTDNTLRPKANTTRAQAAAVFNKIYSIK